MRGGPPFIACRTFRGAGENMEKKLTEKLLADSTLNKRVPGLKL